MNIMKKINEEIKCTSKKERRYLNSPERGSKVLRELFRAAYNEGASDIHIMYRITKTSLAFRINGQLDEYNKIKINKNLMVNIMNCICNTNISPNTHPNGTYSGINTYEVCEKRLYVRYQSISCYPKGSCDLVLRLIFGK